MKLRTYFQIAVEMVFLCGRIWTNRGIKLSDKIYRYHISTDTKINIGNNGTVRIGCISTKENVHLTAWGGNLHIGNHCSFNRNDIVVCRNSITIGNETIIGPNVCIYDHDHVFGVNGKVDGEYNFAPITIGNNVWIGAGAIILRGTTIGDNCVIGAGTVVKGNIPPNSLVTASRNMIIVPLENKEKSALN